MKVVSISDLQLVTTLSHLTQVDLINPVNAHLVDPVLHTLGIDLEFGYDISVYQHRNLQNKVAVGFVAAGDLRIDQEFLDSPWCSAQDRLIIAGMKSSSLGRELMEMAGVQTDYGVIHSSDEKENSAIQSALDSYGDPVETERILKEIEILKDVLYSVRGSQTLKSGALKLPEDYHREEESVPFFRKKKNKQAT